jgi:glutamate carboxypeptidase
MNEIEVLRRLVEVNSFTRNRAGVERVGEIVADLFRPLGFSARRIGNHLALEGGGQGGPALLLVGHLDTVYPENFPWREEGRWIFGPGVCDMKGGIVVMWMALRALGEARARITLLFNASEEGGCADFRPIARAAVTPETRACLVYEPAFEAADGATTIVAERKGSARFRIEAFGREAHSGHSHEKGASAIRELARVVERVESWTDYGRGVTFNVGTIEGGTTVNSVPGHASCQLDVRAWTTEDFASARRQVFALEGTIARVEVAELPGYPPWPPDPRCLALAETARSLGTKLVAPRRGGGSDGCHLWDLVPTLDGLGPVGRNPHTPEESVDRTSFEPRARLSEALIRRLVGQ